MTYTQRAMVALAVLMVTAGLSATPAVASPAHPRGVVISVSDLPSGQRLMSAVRSIRVVYTTADGQGRPSISSAAVYLPRRGGRTAVSWGHGANGLGDRCAPTAMGRPAFERQYFHGLLRAGFSVLATDHIGLGTPGEPA